MALAVSVLLLLLYYILLSYDILSLEQKVKG
jgi:hypothetical protein